MTIPSNHKTNTRPSAQIVRMAFGTFLNEQPGLEAWDVMNQHGLESVLKKFDVYIKDELKTLPSSLIQEMIKALVAKAQILEIDQRKNTLQQVRHVVENMSSIEEVMDHLTIELNTLREDGDIDLVQLNEIYQEKAIAVFDEKIQSGEIGIKDVPKLIARYGLMNTYEFVRHVDEMMQINDPEKVRDAGLERFYGMGYQVLTHMGYRFTPVANSKTWKLENSSVAHVGEESSLHEAVDYLLDYIYPEVEWERYVERYQFEGDHTEFIETKLSEYMSEHAVSAKGNYVGPVVKIEKGLVHQKVGSKDTDVMVHALYRFNNTPKEGDQLDIKYVNGSLVEKTLDRTSSQER